MEIRNNLINRCGSPLDQGQPRLLLIFISCIVHFFEIGAISVAQAVLELTV